MRRKRKSMPPETSLAPVPSEILDQFVRQGPLSSEELEAAVRRFKKAIIERALGGELTHHLGYPAGGKKPEDTSNHRNGTGARGPSGGSDFRLRRIGSPHAMPHTRNSGYPPSVPSAASGPGTKDQGRTKN